MFWQWLAGIPWHIPTGQHLTGMVRLGTQAGLFAFGFCPCKPVPGLQKKEAHLKKEKSSHLETVGIFSPRSPGNTVTVRPFLNELLCHNPAFPLGSLLGLMGRAIPPDRHSPHNLKEQHHIRGSITQGNACRQDKAMARSNTGKYLTRVAPCPYRQVRAGGTQGGHAGVQLRICSVLRQTASLAQLLPP